MTKVATDLGRRFGESAQGMNLLLRDLGYLYGEPGAYGLTEKGKQFGVENYHSRGTGGYPSYNRSWEVRVWADEIVAAIESDLAARAARPPAGEEEATPGEPSGVVDDVLEAVQANWDDRDGVDVARLLKRLAVAGVVVVGVVVVAPHVKPFWDDKVRPTAQKARQRLSRQPPAEPEAPPQPE